MTEVCGVGVVLFLVLVPFVVAYFRTRVQQRRELDKTLDRWREQRCKVNEALEQDK